MAIGYLRLSMSRKSSSASMGIIVMLLIACLLMTVGGFFTYRTMNQAQETQNTQNEQLLQQRKAATDMMTQISDDLGASGF